VSQNSLRELVPSTIRAVSAIAANTRSRPWGELKLFPRAKLTELR